jgi:hypothetical protein
MPPRAGRTGATVAAATFVFTLFEMLQLGRGIRLGVALRVPLRTSEPAR